MLIASSSQLSRNSGLGWEGPRAPDRNGTVLWPPTISLLRTGPGLLYIRRGCYPSTEEPKYLNWSHPYTLEAWRSVILHISIAMSDFGSAGSLRLKRRMWLTEYSGRCSVINQAWLSTYKFWGSKKDFQLYLAKLNDQISDYKKNAKRILVNNFNYNPRFGGH